MTDFTNVALDFCVLIPCFNDEPGLVRSLQSIQYDAQKFAVVVIDDGSTVALSLDRLKSAAPQIRFMHLMRLPQNGGITTALNTGLAWITQNTSAPYIARLDCRDTCHPQRFYKQVSFLNTHTKVGLVGTWCTFKEEGSGIQYHYTTPLHHPHILKAMHLRNVFIHPAVMFRTALLPASGMYPYSYPHAEDYAFFWRLLQVTEGAVLNEYLTTCALVRTGISFSKRRVQLQSRKKVVQAFGNNRYLKRLGIIKLYILLITPNPLLLRLKTLLRFGFF